jgi:hypothetical protein
MRDIIASSEEFGLLLRKWKSEDTVLAVIMIFICSEVSTSMFSIKGLISTIDEKQQTFTIGNEEVNTSTARICFKDSQIGYLQPKDHPLLATLPEHEMGAMADYEDCFAIRCAANVVIIVTSEKSDPAN